jgi:iron complex outermembrane receptor protein
VLRQVVLLGNDLSSAELMERIVRGVGHKQSPRCGAEGAIAMSLSYQFIGRYLWAWALVAATAAFAGSALAAPAAEPAAGPEVGSGPAADNSLQEVVVTAQFRAQNLQDAPLAITAVNAAMLEQRGQSSLHDLAQQAPNVTLLETGGAFGPGMTAYIRGIGQYDFDPALAPGVGIYIDDVYYTSLSGSNFGLLDLDRVEILRGPQGTLAGANTEGGAIKLYSVKPRGNDSGSVKVSYGSRELIDVQGMADVPLIKDLLFMRVSGVSHQQNGYVTRIDYGCAFPTSGIPAVGGARADCVAGHEGGKNYNGGRIAFRWLPADNFTVDLTGDVTIDKSDSAAITLLQANPAAPGAFATNINSGFPPGNAQGVAYDSRFVPKDPYVSYAGFCGNGLAGNTYCWSPDTYSKNWGTSLSLNWELASGLTLQSITGYRRFDNQWTEDNEVSPLSGALGAEHIFNHTVTQELRLSGKIGRLIDYTVGGFYLDQLTTYPTHQVLDYVIPGVPFEFLGNDPIKNRDYAAFANATWHITDALNFNAGVRYTNQEKTYTYVRENPAGIGGGPSVFFPPGFSGSEGRFAGSRTDYRANLDYRWNEELMTYVSVSTGFKGGGINPRPFIASQVQPFGPETLTAYEIGAKSDWFDRRLRVNVAGFYNKYKDIQVTLLSCPNYSGGNPATPCAAPVNGGDADIYGAELEAEYRYAGFSLEGTFSKQHFEYKSVNPASGIPLGAPGPNFQPLKWSLAAQYEARIPNGGSLTPRLDFIYSSGFFTNTAADPQSYVYGYHELNGRITYRPEAGTWEASVVGSNLTDKLWYTTNFDLYASLGSVYGIPSAPRTIWAEFRKKFQ